jgi:hypothetical protein
MGKKNVPTPAVWRNHNCQFLKLTGQHEKFWNTDLTDSTDFH